MTNSDEPLPGPTVSETVERLKRRGYTHAYGAAPGGIEDETARVFCAPAEFTVEQQFRFEGPTDPADEAIVLGLRHEPSGARGVLVAAYGPTSSPEEDEVLRALIEVEDQ